MNRPKVARAAVLAIVTAFWAFLVTPVASAEEPLTEVDLDVEVTFDKPAYTLLETVEATIAVTNNGETTATDAFVVVTSNLDFEAGSWAPLAAGTEVAPGERVEATGTARFTVPVDKVRVVVDLVANGQTDPDDTAEDAVNEAPATIAHGSVTGTVYTDRDRDGRLDQGEGVRGLTVTAYGGFPDRHYEARTDAAGRFSFVDLPVGLYTVSASNPAGWLLDNVPQFGLDEGETVDLSVRGLPDVPPTLEARIDLDRETYKVGGPVKVRVTLTNPEDTDQTGVTAYCDGVGEDMTLRSDGWGDLAENGRGVTVPARSTRVFTFDHVVPEAAAIYGFVSARCAFGEGVPWVPGAMAEAVADVPGLLGSLGGQVMHYRADEAVVPVPGVDIMLVHRSGKVVARERTDSVGHFRFSDVPVNDYEVRVTGPWKLLYPGQGISIMSTWTHESAVIEVVPGPLQGGPADPPPSEPPPDPRPQPRVEPVSTADLAHTGVDVVELMLAGVALLAAGSVLLLVRKRRST